MDERTGPPLRIVRGAPDSTELAAVLLALLSLARQPDDAGRTVAPPPRAPWRPAHGWRPPGSWTAP